MPDNFQAPSHQCIFEALRLLGLDNVARRFDQQASILDLLSYHRILRPHVSQLDLWSTEYAQQLPCSSLCLPSSILNRLPSVVRSMAEEAVKCGQLVLSDDNPRHHPVLEFTKGSFFAPILNAVEQDHKSQLEATYSLLLLRSYPLHRVNDSFEVVFPFRRVFFVATR